MGYADDHSLLKITVRGKILANLANGVQFAKIFHANSYKYSEITEDLPADSPKFSSPFASSVMIRQNFPTYGIPDKTDRIVAASDLNSDLAALHHFGQSWQIKFAPQKTSSLIISLKRDLRSLPHPPLFLDDTVIPETSSVQVLGFTFDALLTWEPHIVRILNRGKQRVSQLYRCRSLLTSQDLCLIYKSWIRPVLEYGNILYTGAASSHLQCLDHLQNRIQQTCCSTFQSLSHHRDAAIIGLVCRLLNGEGRGNLQDYCPRFCRVDSRR